MRKKMIIILLLLRNKIKQAPTADFCNGASGNKKRSTRKDWQRRNGASVLTGSYGPRERKYNGTNRVNESNGQWLMSYSSFSQLSLFSPFGPFSSSFFHLIFKPGLTWLKYYLSPLGHNCVPRLQRASVLEHPRIFNCELSI